MPPTAQTELADFVVVGSGAGGATVAKTLAGAGAEVVVVEEGPHYPVEQRGTGMTDALRHAYRDMGMTVMRGRSYIPYIQGSCVGGTTVINGAIMWRLPEDVLADWLTQDPGLAELFSASDLEHCFDRIEAEISVRPVEPAVEGGNNLALRRGTEALGWKGRVIRRSESGCRGSARCLQGCPHGAKQSMDASYLPAAQQHGARIYADTRIEGINLRRGRVVGVTGWTSIGAGKQQAKFTAKARRAVIVAAGAVQTAALLRRNRVGGRNVGEGVMCHPGLSMAARFDERVEPWQGATQGYEVTELRQQGIKLESLALSPDFAAMRLSGVGNELVDRIAALPHCASAGAALKAQARGRVRPVGARGISVKYQLTDGDVELASRALWAQAEVFRAAGARQLIPSVSGWPAEMDADTAPEWIAAQRVDERQLKFATTHLFGGARAGSDATRSVVSPELKVHGVEGLYVADASVLPSNTGVNPQQTIMAFAMAAAERWLEEN